MPQENRRPGWLLITGENRRIYLIPLCENDPPSIASAGKPAALTSGETHSSWRMTTSNMSVQPYLFFGGRCDEALEFYRSALGAEVVMLSRFKDASDAGMAQPGMEEKVMHGFQRRGSQKGCGAAPLEPRRALQRPRPWR